MEATKPAWLRRLHATGIHGRPADGCVLCADALVRHSDAALLAAVQSVAAQLREIGSEGIPVDVCRETDACCCSRCMS